MKTKIAAKDIYREYVVNGLSDRDIASKYGLDRSTVAKRRRSLGIKARGNAYIDGHLSVKNSLGARGYSFRDRREKSGVSRVNFLVERVCRVQVYTSELKDDGSWVFQFSPRSEGDVREGNDYFVKVGDHYYKDHSKTCDVVIFCGLDTTNKHFIVDSKKLPVELKVLKIPVEIGKYRKLLERWDVIDRVVTKRKGGTQ
ncbi:hypothetical protein PA598K_01468 [Paenibacillus sp. 598K]|uniref:hypothetical protein n=1 Tax=Paenibacillus sp. 598K TaxID=1117987 RepID=UPI000FF99F29|nr:hypothetical protein [Paenibacillus sp. 598K]GBF73183.1 hypothetical protein PA598K_01468 [Paenibacillus sp. 598K]